MDDDEINNLLKDLKIKKNDDLVNTKKLSIATTKKLLKYQPEHVLTLSNCLRKEKIAFALDPTGTGKTYMATAVADELNMHPIIISPKSMLYEWMRVCEYFNVKAYDIVNYETIRLGVTYKPNSKFKVREKCKYLKLNVPSDQNPYYYTWNLKQKKDKKYMVIFDEVHKCLNTNTDNGKLYISTKQLFDKDIPLLMLSATLCQDVKKLKIPLFIMGYIPNPRNFNEFYKQKKKINKKEVNITFHNLIIPKFGARLKISDLGDMFPDNQIVFRQCPIDNTEEIDRDYKEIARMQQEIKDGTNVEFLLPQIQALRQSIELYKIPAFIDEVVNFRQNGKSVAVFVNFIQTINILANKLKCNATIHGSNSFEQNEDAKKRFQSNKAKIIICQINSGGTGISLHDVKQTNERASVISPPWSASLLQQCLGRIHRANGTRTIQHIILAADSIESNVGIILAEKLKTIEQINDGHEANLDNVDAIMALNLKHQTIVNIKDQQDEDEEVGEELTKEEMEEIDKQFMEKVNEELNCITDSDSETNEKEIKRKSKLKFLEESDSNSDEEKEVIKTKSKSKKSKKDKIKKDKNKEEKKDSDDDFNFKFDSDDDSKDNEKSKSKSNKIKKDLNDDDFDFDF